VEIKLLHDSELARTIANWLVDHQVTYGHNLTRDYTTEQNCYGVYAFNDEKLIGGLTFYIYNGWLFLHRGFVLPEHRGQGVYSKLMDRVNKVSVDEGVSGIFVSTYEFEAPHIYEHYGFTHGSVLKDFPKGNTQIDYYKNIS